MMFVRSHKIDRGQSLESAAEPCDNPEVTKPDEPRRRTVKKTIVLSLLGGVAFIALIACLLFGCAARWDLPMFWGYLGVWAAAVLVGAFVVDPTLVKERLRPGPGGQDYVTAVVFTPLWLGQCVVAALDVGRFHWSDTVPLGGQALALVAMAAALAVVVWATAVNPFFSSVIRIQTDRGHHLITSGPYRYVRHPAYAACPFLFIGGGLALGSWLAALIGLLMVLPVLRRTALEDRILREQLQGYAAYSQQVRYRMFPGVW
jgi:protein-S-isoprenylcysteine O-methyltransferase Ste14